MWIEPQRGGTFGLQVRVPPVPGLVCGWQQQNRGLRPCLYYVAPLGLVALRGRTQCVPSQLFQFLKNLTHLCLQFFYLLVLGGYLGLKRVFLRLQGVISH